MLLRSNNHPEMTSEVGCPSCVHGKEWVCYDCGYICKLTGRQYDSREQEYLDKLNGTCEDYEMAEHYKKYWHIEY